MRNENGQKRGQAAGNVDTDGGAGIVRPMVKREDHSGTEIEFSVRKGYLLITEFSAMGGATYETVDTKGTEVRTRQTLDNEALFLESKNLVARAIYVMDNMAQHTPLGYFVDDELLPRAVEAIHEAKKGAEAFNEVAVAEGSERRVYIDVYPLPLTSTDEINLRIARMVHDKLSEVRNALVAGDKKEYKRVVYRTQYIGKLVSRSYERIVEMAFENAKEEHVKLVKALRGGADPVQAGKRLHLDEMEDAIKAFARAVHKLEKKVAKQ